MRTVERRAVLAVQAASDRVLVPGARASRSAASSAIKLSLVSKELAEITFSKSINKCRRYPKIVVMYYPVKATSTRRSWSGGSQLGKEPGGAARAGVIHSR